MQMTVAELIEELQRVSNQQLPVVVRGPRRKEWRDGRSIMVDIPLDYVRAVLDDGPCVVIHVSTRED